MAIDITPGYDFGVTEVPTNAKLQLMLTAMQIANIPKSSLDTGLFGVEYGWLTGSTMATLADEGAILYDLAGKIWVKTATGVCNLRNPDMGGYETVRVRVGDPLEIAINNPLSGNNWYGRIESLASNELFNQVYYRTDVQTSQTIFTLQQHTTVSGNHIRILLCGTGRGTVLADSGSFHRVNLTSNKTFGYVVEKNIDAVNEWRPNQFPAFNDNAFGLGAKFGYCGPQEANDIRSSVFLFGADFMVI
jgi:hypothetical protein